MSQLWICPICESVIETVGDAEPICPKAHQYGHAHRIPAALEEETP